MSVRLAICVFLVAQASAGVKSANAQLVSEFTGGEFSYTVRQGDSQTLVGARFGVDVRPLAEMNGLEPTARLREGQVLRIDNRHLVPQALAEGIIVNIPQRMLFFFKAGRLIRSYPVAVGRPDWPTPVAKYRVLEKTIGKTWYVPKSIQEEMRREKKVVEEKIPPGPENPLGEYWIRISPGCGIHSTIEPASIYGFHTHGCIRLEPDAIADLFPMVELGMEVHVVYQSILLGRIGDGTFLEIHPDAYHKKGRSLEAVRALADTAQLGETIDWPLVRRAIRSKPGIANKVNP